MSLDLIRSRNKWVTKSVLIVIAIVFIFGFGYSFVNIGSFGGGSGGNAAEVNGEPISLYEYYRVRDNLLASFGEDTEIPEAALNFLRARALNQLIDFKLLYQKSKELGLEITDEELKQAIMSNPVFQIDGDFIGFAAYKNFIEQNLRENVGEFERKYKEELLAQKFIDFIFETAKISDEELLNLYRIQNERIKLAYIKFSYSDYLDKVEITDDEVSKHFNENRKSYIHPERREIEYIIVTSKDFEKNIDISDDRISSYYNAYKDEEFLDADGTPKQLDSVKEDIRILLVNRDRENLRRQFISKLDNYSKTKKLSEIAKELSIEKTDTAIFSQKGAEGIEIPLAVTNQTFNIEKGEKFFTNVTDDIWIVDLKDIKSKQDKNLEDAKGEVIADLKVIKAKDTAKNEAAKLHKEILNGEHSMEELKTSMKSQFHETDFFTRLDKLDEINSTDVVLDSFLLSDKNPVSKKIHEISDDFLIISLLEKKQVDTSEFENNKDEIKSTITQRKRNDIYNDWILSIRKQAEIIPNAQLFPEIG